MEVNGQKVKLGQVWVGTTDLDREVYIICENAESQLVAVGLGALDCIPTVFDALTLSGALSSCRLLHNKPDRIIKRSVKALLKGEE